MGNSQTNSRHRSRAFTRLAGVSVFGVFHLLMVGCQLAAQGGGAAAGVAVGNAAWSAEELATANTNCSTTAVAVNPALPKADAVLMCGCIVEDASKKWSFSDFLANEFARTETLFKDGVFDTCRTRVFAQTGGSSTPWTSTQILASRNNCVVAARDANSTISFSQASTACTCVFDVAKGRWTYDAFVQNETAYTKTMVDDGTVGTCLASTLQGTQSTALSKYEGSWRTECLPISSADWNSASGNVTLSFQNNIFVREVRIHQLSDCKLLLSKTTETFTVRQTGIDSANEADRVNFTRTGATLRYFSSVAAGLANNDIEYGFTDWGLGVQHDLLNRPLSAGQTPAYLRDEIIFDLARISGSRLYLGKVTSVLNRTTAAKRPDTLEYQFPYSYLWDTNLQPAFLSTIPNQIKLIGTTFTYSPTANDPDGDNLTYRCAQNCPTGLTVSSSTGSISWPLTAKGAFNDITIEVTDGKATATVAFNIEVAAFSALSISSASPGSSLTPTVSVTLVEESTVTLYSDSTCLTSISNSTLLPSGTHNITTNSLTPNAASTIYAKATDYWQNTSACTQIGTYANDSAAPTLSVLSITTPSPGTTLTPTVAFTLSDAGTVTLYDNDICSAAISSAVSKTSGSQTLVTNSLTPNTTTTIYIKVLDSLLNDSPCTSAGSYTHDTAPPSLSGLSVTTASPGPTLTPTVAFTLSEPATVTLYSNSWCSVAISGAVSKSAGSQTAVTNPLATDTTTTIYIRALDTTLNASECTSIASYTNSTSWAATSTSNAPAGRFYHTAVWTGSKMIVWGGSDGHGLNDGGQYDPVANSWTTTSTSNAPAGRYNHTGVWSGSKMIVWGGSGSAGLLNDGGQYDPVANSWSATSADGTPWPRSWHTAVWSGTKMIVWGGSGNPGLLKTGGQYDPVANSWSATSTSNAPNERYMHTAVWTGSKMIVWGGNNGYGLNDGGQYDPVGNSWSATSTWDAFGTNNAPAARYMHTAVWTGSKMIVWGGAGLGAGLGNTGGQYNPVANDWVETRTSNAPTTRSSHIAVWTGSKMIVWGGWNFYGLNDGGQFDPATNSWSPTRTSGAPAARYTHTAVWTGSKMIVWGGNGDPGFLNDGRVYTP